VPLPQGDVAGAGVPDQGSGPAGFCQNGSEVLEFTVDRVRQRISTVASAAPVTGEDGEAWRQPLCQLRIGRSVRGPRDHQHN
jgi:hypothetical protein